MSAVEFSLILGMIALIPICFLSFFGLIIGLFAQIFPVFWRALVLLLASVLLGPVQYRYVQVLIDLRQTIIGGND